MNTSTLTRYLLLSSIVISFSACSYSTFSGTLIKKPWSKSTQSYCAQGSDYYILQSEDDEYVVKYKSEKKLSTLKGQKVIIRGKMEKITIEPPNAELPSQVPDMGPMGQAFICTVLMAQKIKTQ